MEAEDCVYTDTESNRTATGYYVLHYNTYWYDIINRHVALRSTLPVVSFRGILLLVLYYNTSTVLEYHPE